MLLKSSLSSLVLLLALTSFSPLGHAQEVTGSIVGTVTDSSGAAVPRADQPGWARSGFHAERREYLGQNFGKGQCLERQLVTGNVLDDTEAFPFGAGLVVEKIRVSSEVLV